MEKEKVITENQTELLCPKTDDVFHALFREGREKITKELISKLIKSKIQTIELAQNRHLLKIYPEDKLGILDLKALLDNNTLCNVEVQISRQHDIVKRILSYWASIYSDQIKKGEGYNKLLKTICILILDYEIREIEGMEEIVTKWQIKEAKDGKRVLTEDLEFYIIEIPKARRADRKNADEALQWILFLDNPNSMEVIKMSEENEILKEALKELRDISADKELRERARLKEKYLLDYKSNMSGERAEGRQEGRQEGLKEGLEEGKKEREIEIAKNMLKKNFEIEDITEITGLTKEEIEKLKEN